MTLLKALYEIIYKKPAPYYYNYSFKKVLIKPLRMWVANVVAPQCVFSHLRILLYRACGFAIGKNVFIGMHCYLDDMCYDLISIGNDVTVSYGVYFACHGKNQGHYPIVINDGAYIGMRASIISKNTNGTTNGVMIGKNATVGSCCLVNRDIPDGATAVGVPCKIILPATKNDE